MENHKEWHLLSAFIDNELNSNEKVSVESHFKDCASCQKECDHLQQTKELVATSPRHSMPGDLIDDLVRQMDRPTLGERIRDWLRTPRIWIPAGSLATLLLVFGIWFGFHQSPTVETLPLGPLLAAHSRYLAEGLVPRRHMAASTFSLQLSRLNEIHH